MLVLIFRRKEGESECVNLIKFAFIDSYPEFLCHIWHYAHMRI